jgi:hypothetical protein
MSETPEQRRRRLRWLTLGEIIAVIAVAISALGLWKTWQDRPEKPVVVVEKHSSIPLALRGSVENEGRELEISPTEDGHTLQSLTLTVPTSGSVIEIGSDGKLSSRAIESALNIVGDRDKGTHRLPVRISAKYIEAGADKTATGSYVLTYKWESGGLFGGRSVRLVGFSR